MEASVVQLADDTLLMSLRTQLGGPYLARSADEGKTWSKAVFSGLEGGESCTCLRRIPGSKDIVLFWNNSKFNKRHHHFGGRTPLTAAISSDNGKTWRKIGNIADDPKAEYTNLDCFFTSKGDAILTYMYAKPAWNRKQIHLKAALIDRKWFARNGNTENTAERKAPQAPTIKVAFASVQRGGKPYKTFYNNYIAPHAVLENNTVFTAHQDGQGRPIVAAYDIKSKQWSAPVRASGIGLGADTHGNPSICIDSKRHLHVFFGCHGGAMKHIRSTRPYDISRWTDAPGPTHKATYPQSMRMADGSIYLFFRAGGHLAPWSMSISKDDGQTWTHRKPIIEMRHNFPDKKACSYNAFVPGADYKTVHCFWVYKDDNPRGNKRKYQKLHEAVYRYNVYYARRTAGGRWIAADGAKMSDLPVNKTFCDSHAMIFDSGEEFTAPTRIVIGKDDTPYFRIRHGVTDWKRKKVIVPYKYKFASPVEGKWGLHTEMPGQWPEQIKRLVMSAGPAAFGGRAPNEWFIHYKEGPPEDPKATYIWLGHVENGYVTPKNGPAKSPED
jgi:hypothetical protein